MSNPNLTPFLRHMRQFANPHSPNTVTLFSALKASLRVGLNFPISLALSIGIRILYGHSARTSPVTLTTIPPNARTHLADTPLPTSAMTYDQIMRSYETTGPKTGIEGILDRGHLYSFWALAADKSGLIDPADVKRFKEGEWMDAIAQRRKSRVPGKGEVLPFTRGGPIGVGPHSWFVGRLFGVDVYLPE